jgi:hypothetical protein
MHTLLDVHKNELQQTIESMTPGSEMLLGVLYKPYKDIYPPFAVYEEVQHILRLNLRRFKYFANENMLSSIILRVEDFV